MSIHALSWVLKESDAQRGGRLVLIVLADHAKNDGSGAWPSVATIAHETRMTRRAVQSALRDLEALGMIERQGQSKNGTAVWRVVMGGAVSTPPEGVDNDAGGAKFATSRGVATTPEPSGTVQQQPEEPPSPRKRGKTILSPAEEPEGFAQWLGQHVAICAKWGIERTVPRAATDARSDLARTFAALVKQGYSLEDFEMASEGVLADEFMRLGGHTKPENVLRKSKIAGRIDDGWRAREAESGRVAAQERASQYDGLVTN